MERTGIVVNVGQTPRWWWGKKKRWLPDHVEKKKGQTLAGWEGESHEWNDVRPFRIAMGEWLGSGELRKGFASHTLSFSVHPHPATSPLDHRRIYDLKYCPPSFHSPESCFPPWQNLSFFLFTKKNIYTRNKLLFKKKNYYYFFSDWEPNSLKIWTWPTLLTTEQSVYWHKPLVSARNRFAAWSQTMIYNCTNAKWTLTLMGGVKARLQEIFEPRNTVYSL